MTFLPPEAWHAIDTLGGALIIVLTILNRISSKANSEVLKEVRRSVNGDREAAVAAAEERARRHIAPRVLIVDDDDNDIYLTSRTLNEFGCTIFKATTIQEAETLLLENIGSGRGFPFDFVLVDLKLEPNGSDAIFKLFSEKAPKVPLVILTGRQMGTVSSEIPNIPRIWIQKPLDAFHVQSLLEQFSIPYRKAVKD